VSWLLTFLGIVVLIVLHELGHFAVAKAVGMRVERFSLFFPPRLFGVKIGETEYALGALPLGGYVKIAGMAPLERIPGSAASARGAKPGEAPPGGRAERAGGERHGAEEARLSWLAGGLAGAVEDAGEHGHEPPGAEAAAGWP
jgi:membrane-associated protease RseP (regulator of RpoE activity)